MYGSSGKHGRGGGGGGGRGGGGKRKPSPFPALASTTTHHHRSGGGNPTKPSSSSSGRLSTGGASRNRHAATKTPPPPHLLPPSAPSAPDESFNLVSGDPLSYAMIVKLTPDLVDEIKRLEAQGGTPQIKFDSHAKNSSGNVIDVGGKDFQFTWSRELGDLCDIYEERQSGEDGNGLLVESGCPWRKLDVLRKLDESTKNHVKMRSEEAERKLKARRAIILDHANPAGKSPNTLPAVDVNPRRMPFMPKKEPAPKRPKVETNQASVAIGPPPKSVPKSGSSSASTAKGRLSGSPLPSPPEQHVPSTSPILTGDLTRPPASLDATQGVSKENTVNTEKEAPTKTVRAVRREAVGIRKGVDITPKDMQSMLITLLLENPKGMSLKALEKAIVDTIPNCTKKIEPIIKKIATFQAPGRYILKPGIELENLKKPSSESGSSPEYPHNQTPVQESNFIEKATVEESEPQTQLSSKQEELNFVEKIDIQQHSPDLLCDKKISDNNEGHAGSSSESGSDSESDSDSSDSGSDSGSPSRSKSRSAAGSGSSSDSDSDGSSSSKEGSDVDVDIMTGDDDKDETEQKLQTREVRLSASPIPWGTPDGGPLQNGIDEDKQDGRVSDAVEYAGVLPNDDEETDIIDIIDTFPEKASTRSLEEKMPLPLDRNQPEESQHIPFVRNVGNESQNTKNQLETSDRFEKIPKIKAKRGSDMNSFDEKTESAKRLKTGCLAQPQSAGRSKDTFSPENSNHLTPDRRDENPNKDPIVHMKNKVGRDGILDMSKGYSSGRSVSDSQWSGQRSVDLNSQGKVLDVERSSRYAENLGRGIDESERSLNVPDKSDGSGLRSIHAHDKFSMIKDKHKEAQGEDSYAYEKLQTKNVREGGVGDKQSMFSDSQFRRNGEQIGKLKDARQLPHSLSHTGSFPLGSSKTDMDKSPHVNGKGKLLRRELSELELGELREPLPVEENLGVKKQFEKSNSFKMSKNKSNASDYLDPVLPKGRPVGKSIQESRKQSSPIKVGFANNQDGSFGKRTPEDDNEDSSMRPQQKPLLTQAPQIPRVDRIESEVGSQLNRSADIGSKARKNGTRTSQRIGLEDNGDTTKKAHVSLPQQHDIKHAGQIVVSNSVKETKPRKANPVTELSDRRIDGFCMESNNSGGRKRRESSSDEDDCSYNKYEKDEPELRGPIKDFSQYKDYVQEYCEKYGSYCSLNKNLETYRNKFSKLGNDLEHAKGRDVDKYYNILEQLKESYRQSGTKHKRLKKIFVVLHDELKHLKQRINDFAHPYIRD